MVKDTLVSYYVIMHRDVVCGECTLVRSLWNFEIRYVEKPVTEVHNYLSFSIPNAHCTNIFLLIDLFDPISTLVAVHCRKEERKRLGPKEVVNN